MAFHVAVGSEEDLDTFLEWMEGHDFTWWPIPKGALMGDTILFLIPARSGEIVAAGTVRTAPRPSERWANKYEAEVGQIRFRPNPIPIEVLRAHLPEWGYLRYARNYTTVPPEHTDVLQALLSIERRFDVESGVSPDELDYGTYWEGAIRHVCVNAYERDPRARRMCIANHGTTCVICGFSFGAVYGPAAEGFIHVHHLRPLSEVGGEYEVDPEKDLRPVCPNCHAVLHRRVPAYSIEEVRAFLQQQ